MAVAIPLIAVALSGAIGAQQASQQRKALRASEREDAPAQAGTSSTDPVPRDAQQLGGGSSLGRKKGTLLGSAAQTAAAQTVPGTAATTTAPSAPFSARKTLLGG